jgi:signal transduction histidine kinase
VAQAHPPVGWIEYNGRTLHFTKEYNDARGGKDEPSLRAQITTVAEEMAGALGMTASLQLDGPLDERVSGGLSQDLLHALREALWNAARHGKASQVDVTVEAGSDLVLLVRDDGAGIKDTSHRSVLANLARRAEHHGGTLTVSPADGGGTELCWRAPLRPPRP